MGNVLGVFGHEDLAWLAQIEILRVVSEVFPVDSAPYQATVGIYIDLGYSHRGGLADLVFIDALCALELAAGLVDSANLFLGDRA